MMNPFRSQNPGSQGSNRKWIPVTLSCLAGLLFGLLAWMVAPSYPLIVSGAAFLLAFTAAWLFLVLLGSLFKGLSEQVELISSRLMSRVYQAEEELRSMITIRPVLEDSLVSFNGWAIEGRTGEQLIGLLQEQRLKPESTGLVVECGSGASTILLAQYMKQNGWGSIISLDHDEAFAEKTRLMLQDANLTDVAAVIDAPLREWPVNGSSKLWYDFDPAEELQQKIDLLIVDGPPGRSSPLARYLAVPLLKTWLHPGSVILLHDAHRTDEKQTAQFWAQELGVQPELHPSGKGSWVFRL